MRVPGFWRMAATGMASKLAAGMTSLSLLLLVSSSTTYATAGLAVSCSTLGQGLTAPLRGRLIDRYAARPVLFVMLLAHLTTTATMIVTVRGGAGTPVICASAAAAGMTTPPVAVMMRSLWHSVTDTMTLGTAMALDASMMGTALIIGPVCASWLSLSFSPLLPYVVISAMTVLAVSLVAHTAAVPARSAPGGRWLGVLTSFALCRVLVADALFVMTVTAMDVLLPIYARQVHAEHLTGSYLGILAVGSVLGSFALGAAANRLVHRLSLPLLLGLFAAGCAVLAAATQLSPVTVLVVCPLAGLLIGSLFAALRTTGGALAPQNRVTETMSWLSTVDMIGGAAGAALFAHLAEAEGSKAAFVLVPALGMVAAAISRPGPGRQRQRRHQSC
ncbi:MFS transporter [Streptomyces sp. NPDC048111]|uniref:MFS transporter n=1 Tax=Streptomyces sp. NPDC048111 TaxID=3365500 RepID=UPI00371C03C3